MIPKTSFRDLNDSIIDNSLLKSKFNICKDCGRIQTLKSLCDHRESYD